MDKKIMLKLDGRQGAVNLTEIYEYLQGINRNFTGDDIGEILCYSTYTKNFNTNYDLKVISISSIEIWLEIV